MNYWTKKYGKERVQNDHLDNLFARLQIDLRSVDQELEESDGTEENPAKHYRSIYLVLLEQQRQLLNDMNRSDEFDEDLIRKYLSLIDLEEFKIREEQLEET